VNGASNPFNHHETIRKLCSHVDASELRKERIIKAANIFSTSNSVLKDIAVFYFKVGQTVSDIDLSL